MTKPKRGEVWLVRFPFTDLTSVKLRPSLVWAEHGSDLVSIGIFSRIPVSPFSETWVLIEDQHPEFLQTGLKKTSLVKTEKIALIHESVFHRKLGELPPGIFTQVEESLRKALFLHR